MSTSVFTAEGGTHGAAPTTDTYGTDTPWAGVVVGASQTITFDNATTYKGGMAYRFAGTTATALSYCRADIAASRQVAARFYFRIPSAITGDIQILSMHKTDLTKYWALNLTSGSVLRIMNAASSTVVWTSSGTVSVDTWYRAEILVDNSGGTTLGTCTLNVYAGDEATAVANLSTTLTAQNFGGNNVETVVVGRYGTNSATYTLYLDDVAIADSSTTLLGPSSGTPVYPDATHSNAGSWTAVGGATLHAVLADGSDSTYCESTDNPQTPNKFRVHLQTLSAGGIKVTLRLSTSSSTPGASVNVTLYEGTTSRATWTHSGITTTVANYIHDLSAAELATISDRSNLYLEIDGDV